MARGAYDMNQRQQEVLKDTEARRVFEQELFIGEVTDTIEGYLQSTGITQRELARRLEVTEGRVSQILSGTGNLTLRTLADVAWALGLRFELDPIAPRDRTGTPAGQDPRPPSWLRRLRARPRLVWAPDLEMPEMDSPDFSADDAQVSEPTGLAA